MDAATLRLRSFYELVFSRHFLHSARPRTFDEYEFTLAKWEALSADPPLAEISTLTLSSWQGAMLSAGLAPATCNKHLRHVQALLDKAGPPGPRHRDSQGLLRAAPWVKPLRQPRRTRRPVGQAWLKAIFQRADAARQPDDVDAVAPHAWWQCLICWAYLTGFRRGALLAVKLSAIDWLEATVQLEADDDKTCEERFKPLAPEAVRCALRIRGDRRLLLPWSRSKTNFYDQWHAIQAAAGVPKEKRFRLHDLKRTCGVQLAKVASPWAVRYMLDHAQVDVTGQFYIDPLEELREAVARLPVPWVDDAQGKERAQP